MSSKNNTGGPQPPEPKPPRVPSVRPGQKGGKRDENRRRKVSSLCNAGLTLMLGRGLENVTVDEIAKFAGVAKGSFYRYFNDKEELVQSILEPLRVQLQLSFDQGSALIGKAKDSESLIAAYDQIARDMQSTLLKFPREITFYLQECRGPRVAQRRPVRALADEIAEKAIALTDVAHEKGLLAPFNSRVSALAVVGAAERMLFEVLSGGDLGAPIAAAEALVRIVMDGLRQK
ncbi:MAG: TetR/AcrR family transcriptional regulator [Myxococcota bacterium]|nr:TetR/AcrR family transcriptional regulator [Myxococcota bacterium]